MQVSTLEDLDYETTVSLKMPLINVDPLSSPRFIDLSFLPVFSISSPLPSHPRAFLTRNAVVASSLLAGESSLHPHALISSFHPRTKPSTSGIRSSRVLEPAPIHLSCFPGGYQSMMNGKIVLIAEGIHSVNCDGLAPTQQN